MDSDMKRRNNNNRKRGGKFEKRVADYLGLYPVPYSGSNARFGYGDITDNCHKPSILGECKNTSYDKPDIKRITIKKQWLDDIDRKAGDVGALSFLAFVAKGSPNKFAMIKTDDLTHILELGENPELFVNCTHLTCPMTNKNVINYSFHEDELIKWLHKSNCLFVSFGHRQATPWCIIELVTLKFIIDKYLHRDQTPTIQTRNEPIIEL